jgi:hypothetical protein
MMPLAFLPWPLPSLAAVLLARRLTTTSSLAGHQPYTRWMSGNASAIVVTGNTSKSIHGA